MIEAPNSKDGSSGHFVVWLAALFLVVLGARLWVVQLYGSPLLLWDQWYEAGQFFKPWLEGHLKWEDFFAPYCEHRILFTRLLDLGVISLNGRLEPLLQMTVNAFICTAYVCGLAFCLWDFLGRKNGWLVCCLLMPFFALPYAGENTIWAFNSQAYFLAFFSVPALAGLGFGKPGGLRWWIGLAAAVMGLFTMASGLLTPLAVAGLVILRTIKLCRLERQNLITLGACLAVAGLGAALRADFAGDEFLRAHTFLQFVSALAHNLTWPFFDAPGMALFLALPPVLLAAVYFRPDFRESRAAEFLLVLGLWSVLQSAALAYGRGNFGETIPASRYMDKLNVFVIAGLFAAVLLARFWMRGAVSKKFALLPPLIFAAVIFFGVCRISEIVVENLLLPTRMMNLIAEERVGTFMTTGNERDLLEEPTVRPDPKVALGVLRDASLPPTFVLVKGRFTGVSQWLLRNSVLILYCGLGLSVALVGCALIRSPLGLAWENLPAFIALLTLLAVLGFVWSRAPVKRETIERGLDYKIVDYFKSVNNSKRAAIFEHKAEALGNQ
jgi:hypothetical protein